MSDLNEQLAACPFCGTDVNADDQDHKADCYFTVQREGGNDRAAWNRRAPAATPAAVTNAQITGGEEEGNRVFLNMDERPSKALWTMGNRCFVAEAAPAAAPIVQQAGDETAPLYDLPADKDFAEDFARLAEGIPHVKTRKLVIKAVKQAIAAHGAAERERGRREARAALAAPVVQAEPVASIHTVRGEKCINESYAAIQDLEDGTMLYAGVAPTTTAADAKDAARYRWLRHGDNDELVLQRGPVDPSYVYLPRTLAGRDDRRSYRHQRRRGEVVKPSWDSNEFWRKNTRPGTWGRPRSLWQRFYDWITGRAA